MSAPVLTWCANLHPAHTWPEVFANLQQHVLAVRQQVAPEGPFGVGLRLSPEAASQLTEDGALARLALFLEQNGLYVFTLSGFPCGSFHGDRMKEQVCLPGWLDETRRHYTDLLAELLALLLPERVEGSIGAVLGALEPRLCSAQDSARIADQLLQHLATLHRIFTRTGKRISLGLEPEPCCLLETLSETIAFFERHLLSAPAVERFAGLTGLDRGPSETFLRHHVGICFDACHLPIEREDLIRALAALRATGIRIVKFQLSAGLKLSFTDEGVLAALRPLADPGCLRQGVEGTFGAAGPNTQAELRALLGLLRTEAHCDHLEVETYAWDVLPLRDREVPIVRSIPRELRWMKEQLQ